MAINEVRFEEPFRKFVNSLKAHWIGITAYFKWCFGGDKLENTVG